MNENNGRSTIHKILNLDKYLERKICKKSF